MSVDHELTDDVEHTLAGVHRRMPTDVRDTLTWLAHLLDAAMPLRVAEDEDEFAQRYLGTGAAALVATREELGPVAAQLVARVFGADFRQHPPVETAGSTSDESPTWDRLQLDDEIETVPSAMVAAFEPGTLADVPLVVYVSTRWAQKEFVIYSRAEDAEAAERYLQQVVARARGPENYLRGRCLHVTVDHGLKVRQVPVPEASRGDVIVPAAVWAEIDLNVAALFRRRALLTSLNLGTNRGVLLYGPPGTGKSALCRVLAAELAGEVTVVFCSAPVIANQLDTVYDELTRLSPALVIMEDLDLVVGKRQHGNDAGLHSFLTALDGAMSSHEDVVTVATTNDVGMLDDAAVRAARFDRAIELALPDAQHRGRILQRYLGPLGERVDSQVVANATEGASGADLRELVRRAVLSDGETLTTSTLMSLVRSGAWAPADVGLYL
ncbi:AAA family ATPase [Phytoactinopolyspora limicola]|uniref:AAA family ATPase n=1 Tax=Phytoactinopolyspora limicola TaxID=2715536 RepID=UPI00140C2406|nr:ATP-binding protein [Phytoactinopolyspora limicola]